MKPIKCKILVTNFRLVLFGTVVFLLLLVALSIGCNSNGGPADEDAGLEVDVADKTNLAPPADALLCANCELVEVIEVVDANTVRTAIGDVQMYGAYVIDQPADCAGLALERLTSLAGGAIRVEPGPQDTIRNNSDHYYLFTADGRSIEEQLVREGLALSWTQDGQHVGWFVFRYADARASDAGCLWNGFSAFLRGEPSDFRVPGLTYPEAR